MKFLKLSSILICFAFVGCATEKRTNSGSELVIDEDSNCYSITVPASSLVMNIVGGKWKRIIKDIGGGTSHSRYFFLNDSTGPLVISGWFEPEELFTSVRELWDEGESRRTQGGYPAAINVNFEKIGDWETVMYDYIISKTTANSHIKAHIAHSGTWIDIHMSVTSNNTVSDNRRILLASLVNIVVTEKTIEGNRIRDNLCKGIGA